MPTPSGIAAMFALAALLLAAPGAFAFQLTVQITGAATTEGTVEVSLFDSPGSFMNEPFLQQSGLPGEDGRLEIVFAAVPGGEYAVVAVHDENGNGQLDSGFLGIGAEGYGFSNHLRPWFGWPGFDRASFALDDDLRIEVRLD